MSPVTTQERPKGDKLLREVVVEALGEWLERYGEHEDLAAIAHAERDPTFSGLDPLRP